MGKPIIQVRGLSKRYRLGTLSASSLRDDLDAWWSRATGRPYEIERRADPRDHWALRDVSFDVEPGEVLGIVGHNGSGKSTLLKILSRITEPTEGEALLRGRVASLLEVGTGFHPELSGRENIFINGAILGMKQREIAAKFDEIVAFSEVGRFLDTPVKRYSSGMYVRLAFAVAAHLEPEILIVDEVLAVGDAAFQNKCLGKMKDVSRQGRTVLFVSHNMQAVSTLTQRCLILDDGRLDFDGPSAKGTLRHLGRHEAKGTEYLAPPEAEAAQEPGQHEGEPRIVRVNLVTSEEGGIHLQGKELSVEFTLQTVKPLTRAMLSFQICDSNGLAVIEQWVFDAQLPLCREPGRQSLACVIPRLRLFMGRYHLKVSLGTTQGNTLLQTLDHLCPFEVVMHGIDREWPWQPDSCQYIEDGVWKAS